MCAQSQDSQMHHFWPSSSRMQELNVISVECHFCSYKIIMISGNWRLILHVALVQAKDKAIVAEYHFLQRAYPF